MTAQIRPNRLEVNDRFPMLGFSIRADQADVEAEVALATDINLFKPENRQQRNAANFYTSREEGLLSVPRGEGVFVVPSDVLARFIGGDRLFFGLATGKRGNGGLAVDAVPREGSPYVSLRGLTGRTLRRGLGASRRNPNPRFDWTGDAPRPGSEPGRGVAAAPTAPAADGDAGGYRANGGAGTGAAQGYYDDGFGALPNVPRARARQMSSFNAREALDWIMEKVRQGVAATASSVNPPKVFRLGSNSSTFITAWNTVFYFSPLGSIPALARSSQVTLSVGPAFDTPIAGGGVGVVFDPDGNVGLFGTADLTLDLGSITSFLNDLKAVLQAKFKLGYNRNGIAGFESIRKAAGVAVGEEVVVGAEVWLDGSDQGLGGAVSIGVGLAFQLSADDQAALAPATGPGSAVVMPPVPGDQRARAQRIGGQFADRVGQAIDLGINPKSLDPMLDALDPPAAGSSMGYARSRSLANDPVLKQPPAQRARALDGGASAAIEIAGIIISQLASSQGDVTWNLDQGRGVKFPGGNTPANPAPFKDATTIRLDEWPVAGGLVDDISAWFAIDWQYNGGGLGNVRIGNIGVNDSVGWGLNVRAEIMDDAVLYPPNNCAALRLRFHYRFTRTIGSDVIAVTEVHLYGDGTHEKSSRWIQADALGMAAAEEPALPDAPEPRARAMDGGASAAIAIAGIVISQLSSAQGDVNWNLDQGRGIKNPNDTAPANPAPFKNAPTIKLDEWPVAGGLVDDISAWFSIDWQYNGVSLGNVRIGNIGVNDSVGWGLDVRAEIMDDAVLYPPNNCAALRLRFHYRFNRTIGSDVIAVTDVHLYGDGTHEKSSRWIQADALGMAAPEEPKLPQAPAPRVRAMDGAGNAIKVAGIVISQLASSQGDVTWNLDQGRGIKNPNDTAPANPVAFRDATTIRLNEWPVAGGLVDDISAWFSIDWQYNGTSLGNVRISNIGVNDSVGWGLDVRAEIMDDAVLYPPSNCAALRVRFHYRFSRTIGSDVIAVTEVHLYGDGTHETSSRWIQADALGMAAAPQRVAAR